jgi:hypothetical protein
MVGGMDVFRCRGEKNQCYVQRKSKTNGADKGQTETRCTRVRKKIDCWLTQTRELGAMF